MHPMHDLSQSLSLAIMLGRSVAAALSSRCQAGMALRRRVDGINPAQRARPIINRVQRGSKVYLHLVQY